MVNEASLTCPISRLKIAIARFFCSVLKSAQKCSSSSRFWQHDGLESSTVPRKSGACLISSCAFYPSTVCTTSCFRDHQNIELYFRNPKFSQMPVESSTDVGSFFSSLPISFCTPSQLPIESRSIIKTLVVFARSTVETIPRSGCLGDNSFHRPNDLELELCCFVRPLYSLQALACSRRR